MLLSLVLVQLFKKYAWGSDELAPVARRGKVRGYFLVFVQLFEKYGTLIERYTALIEKVSALTVVRGMIVAREPLSR